MAEDFKPTSIELLAQDRLNTIMHDQAGHLALAMSPYADAGKTVAFAGRFNESLRMQCVDDEKLLLRVPALIDTKRQDNERIFYFDNPTFEELEHDLGTAHSVGAEEVARLYIGVSIATKLLEERLSPNNTEQIDNFWSYISAPAMLDEAVKQSPHLAQAERSALESSLMYLDDNTLARINVLRFGFGMLFMKSQGPFPMELEQTLESRLTEQFMTGLKSQLQSKQQFIDTMRSFRNTPHQAEVRFTESLSELTLGVCFPMSWREMRTILQISQ